MSSASSKKILILGGGFGGIYAASACGSCCRNARAHSLTVVARDNFLLFTPMLHEVASSDIDLTHIVTPVRQLVPGSRSSTATWTRWIW